MQPLRNEELLWRKACRVCGRGLPSRPPSHFPIWRPLAQRPGHPAQRQPQQAVRAGSPTAPTAAHRRPPWCLQAANAAAGPRHRSQPHARWQGCARARKHECAARLPPTRQPPALQFGVQPPQHESAATTRAASVRGTRQNCTRVRAHLRSKRRSGSGGLRLCVCESLQRGGALNLGLCALCRLVVERGAKRLRARKVSAHDARCSASSGVPRALSATPRWPRGLHWPPDAACSARLHCAPAAGAAAQPGKELGARVSTPAWLGRR